MRIPPYVPDEWVAKYSDWRYIKHLDAPTIWEYVNLTVRFDRNLWVALTDTWNVAPSDVRRGALAYMLHVNFHMYEVCYKVGASREGL